MEPTTGQDTVPSSEPQIKPKLKRTRICGPQSKNGCFTCKARRIKCDEEKPSCLRCARSGRNCDGYSGSILDPNQADALVSQKFKGLPTSHGQRLYLPGPAWALSVGCVQSEQQHRLIQRGLELLMFDSFSRFGAASVVVDTLLPQLCLTNPVIKLAAMALGAAFQSQALKDPNNPVYEAFAVLHYQNALRAIRRDILERSDGSVPLIMTCFILSVTEIFLHQEENALVHLNAASKLLQQRKSPRRSSCSVEPNRLETDLPSIEDEVAVILRTVDMQICSYAPSRPPDLAPIMLPSILPAIMDLGTAHLILVQLVHACYHFSYHAYKFKYQPQFAKFDLHLEQGRHIAHLSTWLEEFKLKTLPAVRSKPNSYTLALTFRMTALSVLVYLSCILNPYEAAYTAHASHFQQLICDGQVILSGRRERLKDLPQYHFTTGPGIIQPLFLAALKYRNRIWRRRAITLLSDAGREGPWLGRREARIESRILELEETCAGLLPLNINDQDSKGTMACFRVQVENAKRPLPSTLAIPKLAPKMSSDFPRSFSDVSHIAEPDADDFSYVSQENIASGARLIINDDVPESAMIYSMGMSSVVGNGRPSDQVILRLFKCADINTLLSYRCCHSHDQASKRDFHKEGPCSNNPYWQSWIEMLEF